MAHTMGKNPTTKQMLATVILANAVVDSVRECDRGYGVPETPMYLAFQAHGVTLDQFQRLMSGLVRVGRLTKHGDWYKAV